MTTRSTTSGRNLGQDSSRRSGTVAPAAHMSTASDLGSTPTRPAPPAQLWGSPVPAQAGPSSTAPEVRLEPVAAPTAGRIRLDEVPRTAWWRRFGAAPLLVAADILAVSLVALTTSSPVAFGLSVAFAVVAAGQAMAIYRTRLTMSVLDDSPRLLIVAVLAVSFATLFVVHSTGVDVADQVRLVGLVLLALVVDRFVAYRCLEVLRRRGVVAHRTIILGAGDVGLELARAMIDRPQHGLRPVGFIDAAPRISADAMPAPLLGPPEDLADQIVANSVDHVVIAFTMTREIELVEVIRTCDRLHCEITVVPRLFELIPRTTHTDELHGMPLVRLHRAPFRSLAWPLKRAMDIVLSTIAIVLLSPVLIVTALLVRIVDGPGGILFRQERIGVDDKAFELLKFRSLRPADETEGDTTWNVKGDDRMSWLGAFLRRTSLDELPQLFNILRGDMAIVGPRPERPHFVARFETSLLRYGDRHRVPSGLTGWAQIHGLRGDTSIEERARLDNYYIENWSLWLDLKIILRTVPNIMRGSG